MLEPWDELTRHAHGIELRDDSTRLASPTGVRTALASAIVIGVEE